MITVFKRRYILLIAFFIMRAPLFSQICSSLAANTVVATPSVLCHGSTATLGLLNTYASTGITYQWMMSYTSTVGPWTVIPNATLATCTTRL
jgi:hypothetical protein